MHVQRAAAVAARTRRERCRAGFFAVGFGLALARPVAAAPAASAAAESPPKAVSIDGLWLRLSFFDQYGHGFQSKAGPPQGPGSQRMTVLQPMGMVALRQRNPRWSHQVAFALDVISAASPDGLDAVSSASRQNEAGEIDVATTYDSPRRGKFTMRYGVHFEEPWRSFFVGGGWVGSFFEDNTTVGVNATYVFDWFDYIHPLGWSPKGQEYRMTSSDNLTLTQVLSPTTLISGSYGLTFQSGTLATTWNSIYVADAPTTGCSDDNGQKPAYDCPNRRPEVLPRSRTRHALALQLNQHIPRTRTTIKLGYRYYADTFDLRAHTPSVMLYQWIGRRFYLRALYRYHWQRGVSFYSSATRMGLPEDTPITADSDLAPFSAHQGGIKAVLYLQPPGGVRPPAYLDAGFSRYQRSNDLRVNVFSIGYGREF